MGRLRRLVRGVTNLAGGGRWALVSGVIGLLVLAAALLAVTVFVPQLAIDPRGLTPDQWLTHVQDLRTTVLQGFGGVAVVVGAAVAALNLRETSRQNRAVLELQRRGQTTERFTRAIEQLGQQGPEKLDVRIGGVYALEQIARDSDELHWPIMEVLTAYLREHAPSAARGPAEGAADNTPWRPLPADHQAIATVLGRRRRQQDPKGERMDLSGTNLPGVNWAGAHLEGANLIAANLQEAYLGEAHLEGALLGKAHLEEANLIAAHLEGSWLGLADLKGAWLDRAYLDQAHLEGASLHEVRGLVPDQLRAAAAPERAHLSPEQSTWLVPAAEAPPAAGPEGGAETSGRADSDPR
jgi:Pentapeptide repeats (8 copies)